MGNSLPYLPFFVSDFLVTVGTWPAERVGAYVLALFYQFEHGGLPADDEAELARILHVASRAAALRLWGQIQQKRKFHKRADGLWWNQRLEEVRGQARAKVAIASGRGRSGAAARWGKGANGAQASARHATSNAQADAQALHEQSPDDGIQSKVKIVPPKPPASQGAFRKTRRTRPTRHAASGADQREKTAERDRLIAAGMSREEANRQVFK